MSIKNYGKIGFGTFGSDKYDEKTVADAVYAAIVAGYRIFDCAQVYGNEKQIGKVFKKAFCEGIVERSDLFIISKVWNDSHSNGAVTEACKRSIAELGVEYVDLYFMHWPFPNYHKKGCDVSSRNEDSRPFFTDEFMLAWTEMESLKSKGLVREIGMSNMTVPKLKAVLPLCKTMPYAHEFELHPSFQQEELYDFCRNSGIEIIGYCPLGSPNRPERDKTPDDVADTQLKEVLEIANARNIHPAEVCLKWAATRGHIPIPFASKTPNILANKNAVESYLDAEEMQKMRGAESNCRLVKGHVFLWEGAQDWRDLWDTEGTLSQWVKSDKKWIKK